MEIFVSNIPFAAKPEDVRKLFEPFGTVGRVNLITDRETGRPRGFGFVEMPNASEAQAAIAALQNVKMEGRQLTINEARPREPRRDMRRDH
ncbi:MAG: RNA-binding protein [candidate division KSB1 bacterium]|nr:RNA-binding protein [candidate division KSB1 bacterium]